MICFSVYLFDMSYFRITMTCQTNLNALWT